ncbi:hypothetical protein [Pyrococcus yayanosii]|uniref:Uncharacterized protein n=1 Tax=Pyrococcus yayanosii (strain CH1 / JCM 16557) TaxID=529709 RepID=F8AFZ2_PYRYC|nr:hypothetical protein [Pyrococcus yayanosii]AEH25046.1 hypothetical protein PYCH_13760 [Pyrococcus yayanosii CH1]
MDWRSELKVNGFLQFGDFIIELVYVDCPCDTIPPILAVYDAKTGEWYRVDETPPTINNYTEAWTWAVDVLERFIEGEQPKLVGLDGPAPEDVIERFLKALRNLPKG